MGSAFDIFYQLGMYVFLYRNTVSSLLLPAGFVGFDELISSRETPMTGVVYNIYVNWAVCKRLIKPR